MKEETKTTNKVASGTPFEFINIDEITTDPRNERNTIEDIDNLAENIKAVGLINPITVRPIQPGSKRKSSDSVEKFMVIAGERRFLAHKKLSLTDPKFKTIACYKIEADELLSLEIMLSENMKRKDLSEAERANMIYQIFEAGKGSITTQQIADKLGVGLAFVNRNVKVFSLIPVFRDAYLQDRLTLNEAIVLVPFSHAIQKQIAKDIKANDKDRISISNVTFYQYNALLYNAKFDINDPQLYESEYAGTVEHIACTMCPFNTASQPVLFEASESGAPVAKARCTKVACFRAKTEITIKRNFELADSDPSIEYFSDYGADKTGEMYQKIKKSGRKIYEKYSNCDVIEEPEPVEVDKDDYDTVREYKEAVTHAKQRFEKEKAMYEKLIKSKQIVKAIYLNGDDRGQFLLIKIRKSNDSTTPVVKASDVKEAIKSGEVTEELLKGEIARLKDNAKRKEEIESNKLYTLTHELLSADKAFPFGKVLSTREAIAAIVMLNNIYRAGDKEIPAELHKALEQSTPDKVYMALFKMGQKKLEGYINIYLRYLILSKSTPGGEMRPEKFDIAFCVQHVADEWNPAGMKALFVDHSETMQKYKNNLSDKLKALNQQFKELPKKESPKAPVKKKSK